MPAMVVDNNVIWQKLRTEKYIYRECEHCGLMWSMLPIYEYNNKPLREHSKRQVSRAENAWHSGLSIGGMHMMQVTTEHHSRPPTSLLTRVGTLLYLPSALPYILRCFTCCLPFLLRVGNNNTHLIPFDTNSITIETNIVLWKPSHKSSVV